MTDSIIIQIPDPNLRQFKGKGPTFIETIPPNIEALKIYVDWMLIVYIDKPWNHHVKAYLEKCEAEAKGQGLNMQRYEDLGRRQFVYSFERVQ